jgi:hypothetical protein
MISQIVFSLSRLHYGTGSTLPLDCLDDPFTPIPIFGEQASMYAKA